MERVVVRIGGGSPWGFRLGGGGEERSPLRVLKVRRHSRAWRAGLRDGDELVLINGYPCRDATHSQAGQLMEARASALLLVVSRQIFPRDGTLSRCIDGAHENPPPPQHEPAVHATAWHSDSEPAGHATAWHSDPEPTGHAMAWHSDPERLAPASPAMAWYSDPETAGPATARHSDPERLAPSGPAMAWYSDPETAGPATAWHSDPKSAGHATARHSDPEPAGHATALHSNPKRLAPAGLDMAWYSDPETAGPATARHSDPEPAGSTTVWHSNPEPTRYATAWHSDTEPAGHARARHNDPKRPVSAAGLATMWHGDLERKGHATARHGDPEPAGKTRARHGDPKRPVSIAGLATMWHGDLERKGHATARHGDPERPASAVADSAAGHGDPEPLAQAAVPPPVTRVYVSPCNEVTDLGRVRERKARAITNSDPARVARCNASYVQKGIVCSLGPPEGIVGACALASALPVSPAPAEGNGEPSETVRASASAAASTIAAAPPLSISLPPTEVRRERTVRKATQSSRLYSAHAGEWPDGAFVEDASTDQWAGGDGNGETVGGYGGGGGNGGGTGGGGNGGGTGGGGNGGGTGSGGNGGGTGSGGNGGGTGSGGNGGGVGSNGVGGGDVPVVLTSAADINLIAMSLACEELCEEEVGPAESAAVTTTAVVAAAVAAAASQLDQPGEVNEVGRGGAGEGGRCRWQCKWRRRKGVRPTRMQGLSRYGGAVPMLGPVEDCASEELTTTYRERAKQARLHRGESSSDRQVKEAKTKCRTIASLLTEAPDPHSRGVLMFKKRRRRAKHYTLVSFGEGDDTDGGVDTDAGLDTDAAPYTSESDLDEDSAFTDLEQEMEAERARAAAASAVAQLGTIDGLTGRGAEMFKKRQRNAGVEPAVNGDAPDEWVFLGTEDLPAPWSGPEPHEARDKFFERPACGEAQQPRSSQQGPPLGVQLHNAAPQNSCAFVQPMMQVPPAHQVHPSAGNPGVGNGVTAFQQITVNSSSVAQTSMAQEMMSSSVKVNSFQQEQQQQHKQQMVVKTKQVANVVNRTARPFTPAGPIENRAATPFAAQPAPKMTAQFNQVAGNELPLRANPPERQGQAPEIPCVAQVNVHPAVSAQATVTPAVTPVASPAVVAPRQRPSVNINYVSAQSPQRGVNADQHGSRVAAAAGSYAEASPVANPAPVSTWSCPDAEQSKEGGPSNSYLSPASPQVSQPVFANNPSLGTGDPPAYQPVTSQSAFAGSTNIVPPPPAYAQPAGFASTQQHSQAPPPTPVTPLPQPQQQQQQQQQTPVLSVILPPPLFAQPTEQEQSGDAAAAIFNGLGTDTASTSTDRDRGSAIWSPEPPVEQMSSREQRISIPAARSGILAEAKKRNQGNKAMFTFKEPPKNSPNPDLLSLVQNLDDKTKPEGQFEVGLEEDSLGLGAEASNFWQTQAQAQGFKSPPPVAPKPMAKVQGYEAYTQLANQAPSWSHQAQAGTRSDPLPSYRASDTVSNDLPQQPQQQQQQQEIKATLAQPTAEGARIVYSPENNAVAARKKAAQSAAAVLASDMSQMKGKGAQLFAKRQSRMEKYIVDGTLSPAEEMRGPSPTPSLPSSWKYSSQIRAPPPIGFNPILSPFYPLAAAKGHATQNSPKSPAAAKTKGKPKPRMESLDVMKHQPYQLNSAMFSFSPPTPAAAPAGGSGRQAQSLPRNAPPPTAAQASEATRSHLAAQNQASAMVTTQLQMEVRSVEKPAQQQTQQQQPTKSFATVLPQQMNGISTSAEAMSSPQISARPQPLVSAPSLLNGPVPPTNYASGDDSQLTTPPSPHQHRVTSHIQMEVRSAASGVPSIPAVNAWQQPPPTGLAPAYPGGHQPPPYPGHAGDNAGPTGFGTQLTPLPAEPPQVSLGRPGTQATLLVATPRPSFSAKKNRAQAQVWRPGVAN
ncbi:uncharacterized protein LOC133354435 [Lethenteron reissneri]|uniref:uncharacterized protein LOC133354435 n=1 Tax=Lethenteron reissneri TaxID=7753 RepID=UPI002AB60D66|nr:uncharacterized protein LOC133354435 [Lethenteron reissneri]